MTAVTNPEYEKHLAALRAKKAQEALAKLAALKTEAASAPTTHVDMMSRQQKAAEREQAPTIVVPSMATIEEEKRKLALVGAIEWNERQSQAITLGTQGKSFVLIGAAGTGKTTTLKGVLQELLVNHLLPPLTGGTKYLTTGSPGIVLVSYTRRAVRQIARQMQNHPIGRHCLTIHKLLEFEPVWYEIEDAEGNMKRTMRFEPTKNSMNPLPNIRVCVVDESSMVSVDLFNALRDALPRDCVFIFLGDLHQLPPVYGESILAVKLQELPIVELTEVYRQALDSPIIRLATDIKDGKDVPFPATTPKIKTSSPDGKSNVVLNHWGKTLANEDAADAFAATIKNVINTGNFNEDEDVILMPHHKPGSVGCHDLNLNIANALGLRRGAMVHHVIAGYVNHYLAAGDRLLVDKQDCVIKAILPNPKYVGKAYMEPDVSLDRWGTYQDEKEHHLTSDTDEDIDAMFERMSNATDEDKVNEASHVLVLESLDSGSEFRVSQIGVLNSMVFSYALTVHKSQGSEWRRVFLFLHKSHHAMCSRELIYTAVTRAREDLIIICEPDRRGELGTLTKAARSPRIRGNTLAEKLAWLRERAKERLGNNGEEE